ncbi:hypothetical protein CDD83_5258 [Cordyceps sp. RAO-2017]|nr:hypothetical protein CDD83_5258 [Cordyceps sp. RAO-2017]
MCAGPRVHGPPPDGDWSVHVLSPGGRGVVTYLCARAGYSVSARTKSTHCRARARHRVPGTTKPPVPWDSRHAPAGNLFSLLFLLLAPPARLLSPPPLPLPSHSSALLPALPPLPPPPPTHFLALAPRHPRHPPPPPARDPTASVLPFRVSSELLGFRLCVLSYRSTWIPPSATLASIFRPRLRLPTLLSLFLDDDDDDDDDEA